MNKESFMQSLLQETATIKQKRAEELKNSGQSFNVFSILDLEYNEARLHSQLIADLLHPQGAHGQGILFLQKFLDQLEIRELDALPISQAKVYAEEYIGPISTDCTEGGFIDIVIKIPHNHIIVIENKISAADQRHQLIRYKNNYPNSHLLYLTKDGRSPSLISTHLEGKVMKVDFSNDQKNRCISYEVQILQWLESCYREIRNLPLLKETLFQYITTIKKITNQTTDNYMSTNIADTIVSNNANLDCFFTLRDQKIVKAVERKLLYKFIDEMEVIAKDLGLVFDESDIDREMGHEPGDTEIQFHIPGSPYIIAVGFESWRMDFCVGIGADKEIEDKELKQKLSKHFSDLLGKDSDYPNWYYLLHVKNSKHGDEYLSVWQEGSFDVWGAVNSGAVSQRMKWYFATFLKELRGMNLIAL